MLSPLIALASSLADQLNTAIIKKAETNVQHATSIWDAALISIISGSLFIFAAGFGFVSVSATQIFSGMFWVRIILEVFQVYVTYSAIKYAQLSSYNFVRSFSVAATIILEIILLGTVLSSIKYAGIAIITLSVAIVFRNGLAGVKGWAFLLASAINGGVLNAIAKYQYASANAYATESLVRIGLIAILATVAIVNNIRTKNSFLAEMKSNKNLLLSIPLRAIASLLSVAALNLGSAALYVAAERGGSVLFGVLLGHGIFKEKSLTEKILIMSGVITGITLIAFG